ncbi:MAG: helix-turn-helix domain-containing protein [Cryobacterium sp.]
MVIPSPQSLGSNVDKPVRARPLALEDRQAMLIDVVTPLLIEHGQSLTTRQIAEAAGIAEGTIFRAFATKEELVQAVVDRHLDPEPFRRTLRGIDLALPLPERVHTIVGLMRERFTTVFTLMTALGLLGKPHPHDPRREFTEILSHALAADLDTLNFSAERCAQIIRMVTLAACMPLIHAGAAFTDEDITDLILYGIAGTPTSATAGTAGGIPPSPLRASDPPPR